VRFIIGWFDFKRENTWIFNSVQKKYQKMLGWEKVGEDGFEISQLLLSGEFSV